MNINLEESKGEVAQECAASIASCDDLVYNYSTFYFIISYEKCGEKAMEAQKQKLKRTQKEISKPEDFTDPEVLYNKLITTIREYHPSTDLSMVEKAYKLARDAHKDQKRKSGEPYIIHPLCVAIILAELELDKETIVAGLLHDVVEDTTATLEDLSREFNDEVALLVDGVTKLGQLSYSHDKMDLQAENLRKMFLAMAKDIRVILIKLADRLHNMRTLQYMKPENRRKSQRDDGYLCTDCSQAWYFQDKDRIR